MFSGSIKRDQWHERVNEFPVSQVTETIVRRCSVKKVFSKFIVYSLIYNLQSQI